MKHFRSFSRTKKIVALGAVAALTLGVAVRRSPTSPAAGRVPARRWWGRRQSGPSAKLARQYKRPYHFH